MEALVEARALDVFRRGFFDTGICLLPFRDERQPNRLRSYMSITWWPHGLIDDIIGCPHQEGIDYAFVTLRIAPTPYRLPDVSA